MAIELSESNSASPHAVAGGEEVVLRLAENPTTGYRWEVTQSGVGELRLIDDQFVAGAGLAAPGAGGHRVLRFAAGKPGGVQLVAVNKRAWESGVPPSNTQVYSIVVR
jgi:inhibitor of cysteine peptidase